MKGRIAFCNGPNLPFELDEFEVAPPGEEEILVRVTAAGICGSDLHMWRGEVPFLTALPVAAGHEMVGRVEALGRSRQRDSLGQQLTEGRALGDVTTLRDPGVMAELEGKIAEERSGGGGLRHSLQW